MKLSVEILGIQPDALPESGRILAKISGDPVDTAGIMAGMSGSPVYINDQLIGAIAYAFPFATEAICAITPIQDMRNLMKKLQVISSVKNHRPRNLISSLNSSYRNIATNSMVPISIPVVCSGINIPQILQFIQNADSYLWPQHFLPISGTSSGKIRKDNIPPLRPGSPLGAVFIDGDIQMSALGTVTEIIGDRIFAFGHSMMNLGHCEVPFATSEVVTFIPTLANSFKLSNSGPTMGTIEFDSQPGIAGTMGKKTSMIPLTLKANKNSCRQTDTYLRILDDPMSTASFAAIGTTAALFYYEPRAGDLSYKLELEIYLRDHEPIRIKKFAGLSENPLLEIFQMFQVIQDIQDNPIEPVVITNIIIDADIQESVEAAVIQTVEANFVNNPSNRFLDLKIRLKHYRKGIEVRHLTIPVEANIPPGQYLLAVYDAVSYHEWLSEHQLPSILYSSLDQLLEEYRKMEPNNRLNILLLEDTRDVFTGNAYLPDSPPTLEIVSTVKGSGSFVKTARKAVIEKAVEFPFEVIGNFQEQILISGGESKQ